MQHDGDENEILKCFYCGGELPLRVSDWHWASFEMAYLCTDCVTTKGGKENERNT